MLLSRARGADLFVLVGLVLLLSGSGVVAAAGPPTSGGTNHALTFDGVDDWAEASDPLNASSGITIEAWVKPIDTTNAGRIVSDRELNAGYEIDITSTPELRLAFNGSLALTATYTPALGEWAHVAAVWDSTTGYRGLWIDGVNVAEWTGADAPNPSSANLRFGRLTHVNTFDGTIDEVRIWGTALDGATIAEWMSKPLDPSHPNWSDLLGYWTFDEGAGQTAASEVNSSAADARLGDTASAEDTDPTWTTDAALAVETRSFGKIKGRYR